MHQYCIDVLCLQETRASQAEYYTYRGYRVILSGAEGTGRQWAGVGVIVSPRFSRNTIGFLQYSDRLASLTMKGT